MIGNFERVRALWANPRMLVIGGVRSGIGSELRFVDVNARTLVGTAGLPAAAYALVGVNDSDVAAGCGDGVVRVFDAATGALKSQLAVSPGVPVLALAVLPAAGAALACCVCGCADGTVRVVEAGASAVRVRALSAQPIRALAARIGEDGARQVFAAGDDGLVRGFSLDDADGPAREMAGHDGPVLSLALLPARDGRLASGGDDGTIRFWYLTGAVEHERKGNDADAHQGPVQALL
ncbi:MAG TPA: hypothetical protein VGO62_20390, partial [Myxococcota bacterium]